MKRFDHVLLERITPRDASAEYPVCLAGRRAGPPEDCGGVWGYERFLQIIRDPTHEEHEHLMVWSGGAFDPERFDKEAVRFDDPQARWQLAFLEE
jgi:hypothetical protein